MEQIAKIFAKKWPRYLPLVRLTLNMKQLTFHSLQIQLAYD
jgi:hypothetical protein